MTDGEMVNGWPRRGRVSRRGLLRAAGLGGFALGGLWHDASAGGGTARALSALYQSTPETGMIEELVIDLALEPPSLDPAIVYDIDSWSVVHSIFDSLVQYGPSGELELVLAESLTQPDPLTYEITLRPGISFHNGEPVDAKAVVFSVNRLLDPDTSQVSGNLQVITAVTEIDLLTVHLTLSEPAPWLPSLMAAWFAIVPPGDEGGDEIGLNPVGSGPFRFVEWQPGDHITVEANEAYFADSPKGRPIAQRVTFRFVPEASTRVADLLAGTAGLVRTIPDLAGSVEDADARLIATPVTGAAFVRIATDVEPFSDVRVRQALNYAVDVDAIVEALLAGNGARLANLFVEGGLGYDPKLAPYPYDPEQAKALLAAAGYADGFSTAMEHTIGDSQEIATAVAGQLAAIGIQVELQARETATFNDTWKDPEAAPLRFATWRPLFDPFTLISLLISNEGFLSRYDNPNAQPLIDAGAVETDPATRAETYRQLGQVLHEEPAAIYLFNLTALYGAAEDLPEWTPRADDYIIPTRRDA